MHILVTAGNTHMPIDRVRVITNIFSGRTGAAIAVTAASRGHRVQLLTSHPETVPDGSDGVQVVPYRTYDELAEQMAAAVGSGRYQAVIHAAAVSDYRVVGAYAAVAGAWQKVDAGKIRGSYPELWLRLVPTPKLVDRVRREWGFTGVLVKFKLEVGVSEAELEQAAEAARRQSQADLLVANTLEGMEEWALVGPRDGRYERCRREQLPQRLLELVEALYASRTATR